MPRGGARNRSGPRPEEQSGRSDRRGYKLTALPAEGYDGPPPPWPLSRPLKRELDLWAWLWTTPQACAWAMESETWRIRTVAMYARVAIRCEERDAPGSILAQLHRLGDQIGMTTAGLAEMGWKVATDEVSERREEPKKQPAKRTSARDRMTVVKASGE